MPEIHSNREPRVFEQSEEEREENQEELDKLKKHGPGPKKWIDNVHGEALEEDKIRTIIKETKDKLRKKIDEGKK